MMSQNADQRRFMSFRQIWLCLESYCDVICNVIKKPGRCVKLCFRSDFVKIELKNLVSQVIAIYKLIFFHLSGAICKKLTTSEKIITSFFFFWHTQSFSFMMEIMCTNFHDNNICLFGENIIADVKNRVKYIFIKNRLT